MEEHEQGLEPMVPMEVETVCPACAEKGTTRVMLVPDEFFQGAVVTTFTCPGCRTKDTQTIEIEEVGERGVKIEARLDRPEDLRRYLVLAKGAEIEVESGERGIAYTAQEDAIAVVEGVVRTLLEKIVSMGTMPEDRFSEEELEGLGEYKDTALFLQKSLQQIDLMLKITDARGVSRLFPAGETPRSGARDLPLAYFEDERTKTWEYEIQRDVENAQE